MRYSARWPSSPREPRAAPLQRRARGDLPRDRQPPRDQGRARLQDGGLPPGRRRDRPQPARDRARLPRGPPARDPRGRLGHLRQDRRARRHRPAPLPGPAPRRGPAHARRAPRDPGRRAEDGAPALGAARHRDARRPPDGPSGGHDRRRAGALREGAREPPGGGRGGGPAVVADDARDRGADRRGAWRRCCGDVPGVRRVEPAGSFRRRRETIGDLDLLVETDDAAAVIERFTTLPGGRVRRQRGSRTRRRSGWPGARRWT